MPALLPLLKGALLSPWDLARSLGGHPAGNDRWNRCTWDSESQNNPAHNRDPLPLPLAKAANLARLARFAAQV